MTEHAPQPGSFPPQLHARHGFARGLGAPAIVRAQGLTKVKITQPSESLSYMPIYVGRAKDFFKEAGIDLQLVVTRGDGPDVQALMAKEVEFVATPPHHLYTLYLQNRKLLGICGILGRCGINMVISKEAAAERNVSEDSPFEKKLAALKGLTFGVSTPGSLTYNMGLYYILRAGLKPQVDAKVVGTGVGHGFARRDEQQDCQCLDVPFADGRRSRASRLCPVADQQHPRPGPRPQGIPACGDLCAPGIPQREHRPLQAHDRSDSEELGMDQVAIRSTRWPSDPAVLCLARRKGLLARSATCGKPSSRTAG